MTFSAAGLVGWLALAQIAPSHTIAQAPDSTIDGHPPSTEGEIAAEPGPARDVRSPADIEASKLGPPVRTKTLRLTPDGKPK